MNPTLINATRLRELCSKGLNPIQVAERLGATPNAVYKACARHQVAVAAVEGYESRANSSARPAWCPIASSGSKNDRRHEALLPLQISQAAL